MISLLAIILLSYIAGSIPHGVILGRVLKGIDVREHGSKNIGATNVFRVLGAKIAIPVLFLDIVKGTLAVVLITQINFGDLSMDMPWLKIIAAFSAIFGHVFSFWVKFKGGKGVATATGVFFGIMPLEVGMAIVLFILVIIITRFVSLGSILATLFLFSSLVVEAGYLNIPVPKPYMVLALFLIVMVIVTHRQNIIRLVKGEENKIRQKPKT